ncbi:hypothetical protein EV715DRAFT_268518 [Schizophyllum commune]
MDATPSDLLDTKIPAERQRKRRKIKDIIYPYPNVSSFLFNHHHHIGGATKTLGERDRAYQLMNDPRFHSEDVCGVNFKKMDELVAADVQSPWEGNGWTTTPVTIKIPTGQKMTAAKRKERARERAAAKRHETVKPAGSDDNCYQYHAANVHTQSLMHILKSAVVEEELSKEFHWHPSPYEEQWTPPYEDFNVESVYGEPYGSEAFRLAERELLATPAEPGCDLPRIAQFGPSKAWPLYVFFGNLSMHKRMKPSTHAAHQAAFFPSLPDSINDFLRSKGITPTAPLLTHCRRELFHEVWKVLLSDEEFRYAYEHGVVLMCADGIKRRIYARLFTHSADYPEKVLIATIRDLGACLCTRCTVPKSEIRALGTNKDHDVRVERKRTDDWSRREKVTEARHIITMTDTLSIARQSRNFSSANHLFLLSPQNAFSAFASQLTRFHFDVFEMLVTDFMHEFELGVWKSPLTHLIRMLYSPDRAEVLLLNARFRMTPNFGYDTIRYFRSNVAELKQLAAHDYEDTLQCSIPCLEGLFDDPAHDKFIQKLLYLMAYWHSLAKLQMHTSSSVNVLDRVTSELGKALRYFADVICPTYATRETDHEFNSRKRMEAKKASTTPASSNMASPAHNASPQSSYITLVTLPLTSGGTARYCRSVHSRGNLSTVYSNVVVCVWEPAIWMLSSQIVIRPATQTSTKEIAPTAMYPATFRPSKGSQAILVRHKLRVSDCRAPPPPRPFIPPAPGESGSAQNPILLDVDVDEHVEVDAAQPKHTAASHHRATVAKNTVLGAQSPPSPSRCGSRSRWSAMHDTRTKKLSYVEVEGARARALISLAPRRSTFIQRTASRVTASSFKDCEVFIHSVDARWTAASSSKASAKCQIRASHDANSNQIRRACCSEEPARQPTPPADEARKPTPPPPLPAREPTPPPPPVRLPITAETPAAPAQAPPCLTGSGARAASHRGVKRPPPEQRAQAINSNAVFIKGTCKMKGIDILCIFIETKKERGDRPQPHLGAQPDLACRSPGRNSQKGKSKHYPCC